VTLILEQFKARCFNWGQLIKITLDKHILAGVNTYICYQGSLVQNTGDKLERLGIGDAALNDYQEE